MSNDYEFLDGRETITEVLCFENETTALRLIKQLKAICEITAKKGYIISKVEHPQQFLLPGTNMSCDNTRQNKALVTFKKIK